MKKLFSLLWIPLLMNGQETPKSEIVNLAGKWYFGVEMGQNTITSYSLGESNKSFQGGILAEFYTGRHWSLTGRVKYFKTGLIYFDKVSSNNVVSSGLGSSFFGPFGGGESKLLNYYGELLTVPVNIKWEFRIWKNLAGNYNFGLNYNFELKKDFSYSSVSNYDKYYFKQYWSYNYGYGFNYFLNNKSAVSLNVESYIGQSKGGIQNTNTLLNFGYKYSFKN